MVHLFCQLYIAHRDFRLASGAAKRGPITYKEAEASADLTKILGLVIQAEPKDFMSDQDSSSNEAIDKYVELKKVLNQIKGFLGCQSRDIIYKAVKRIYNKSVYCVDLDFYFAYMVDGFIMYLDGQISFEYFKAAYFVEISLFTGKRKPLKIREVLKIAQYILSEIGLQSVKAWVRREKRRLSRRLIMET